MSSSRRPRREWLFLGLCLAARLALGLAYSQIVPPWESYDEPGHFQYARYLAKYGRLLQPGDPEAESIWSKFQPPLYYALIAPALLPFDLGDRVPPLTLNPFFANGNAGANYAVTPDQPAGLEASLAAALRAGRALSGLLSAVSLVFVYWTARRLWPAAPAAAEAAAILYAFWPQFMFLGNMLTNDMLVSSLAAPILYLIIRGIQDGPQPGRLIMLSVLIFAALLTKLNGLALIPAALVPLAVAMRTVSRRRLALTAAGLALLVLAALAWLSTMPFVTGQVFQFAALQRLFDNLGAQAGQAGALANAAVYGFWTFFASYGWGNLETWGGLYTLWLLGAGAAVAGLVFGRRRPFSAAIGWGLVLTPVSLVGLSTALSIAQNDTFLMVGRYWLPALPSVVLLLVGGWQALTPARWRTWAWRAAAWIIVGASWIAPFAVIAPAYAKPQPMTASQAARLAPGSAATFAGSLRLLGYVPPEPGQPGGPARLGVCWEALATPAANYPVQLEVIGPDGQGYGARSTWAGGGNYPPRLWEIGRPFCDTYETLVWESFPAPAVGMLRLRLQTGVFGPGLAVSGPAGEPLGDDVRVPFVVRAAAAPAPLAQAADYRFGGTLRLIGYEAAALPEGNGLRVRLLWQAAGRPDDDYKVFVHLRDTPQTAWTQSDQRPRGGAYPTPAWAADERVLDEHVLTWPAGVTPPPLTLYVGLYRAADGTRPAVQDGLGQPVPNGEVSLPLP